MPKRHVTRDPDREVDESSNRCFSTSTAGNRSSDEIDVTNTKF